MIEIDVHGVAAYREAVLGRAYLGEEIFCGKVGEHGARGVKYIKFQKKTSKKSPASGAEHPTKAKWGASLLRLTYSRFTTYRLQILPEGKY